MKQLPLSYIELSKKNLIHNIKQFRRIVKRGTKIAGVVKASAYGHGDVEVVKVLNPYVDYFQINSVEELEKIRTVTKKPILLLGYVGKGDISRAIKLGCILTVFDLHHALLINESARKLAVKQKVHISIDAHLGREGLLPSQVSKFLLETKKIKNLSIDGVYAHFANIEDTRPTASGNAIDLSYANKQISVYEEVINLFKKYLPAGRQVKTHISATSGVLAYEKWKGIHNIVRVGVGLYGMWPSIALQKLWQKKIALLPVMRLVTHIAQVKTIPAGESIGYGLSYMTRRNTMIAIIPQGYSNGISRLSSSNGEVLIKGKRAPILGRVAMNMFVVDVSHIKGAKPEDEVVILGTQKGDTISAEDIAKQTQTINYEVTTRMSALLPRIVR